MMCASTAHDRRVCREEEGGKGGTLVLPYMGESPIGERDIVPTVTEPEWPSISRM